MSNKSSLKGMDKLRRKLDKFQKTDEKAIVDYGGNLNRRAMKMIVPVQTGALKRSIKKTTTSQGTASAGLHKASVYPTVEYAGEVNAGGGFKRPSEFIKKTHLMTKNQLIDYVRSKYGMKGGDVTND